MLFQLTEIVISVNENTAIGVIETEKPAKNSTRNAEKIREIKMQMPSMVYGT